MQDKRRTTTIRRFKGWSWCLHISVNVATGQAGSSRSAAKELQFGPKNEMVKLLCAPNPHWGDQCKSFLCIFAWLASYLCNASTYPKGELTYLLKPQDRAPTLICAHTQPRTSHPPSALPRSYCCLSCLCEHVTQFMCVWTWTGPLPQHSYMPLQQFNWTHYIGNNIVPNWQQKCVEPYPMIDLPCHPTTEITTAQSFLLQRLDVHVLRNRFQWTRVDDTCGIDQKSLGLQPQW